MEAGKLVYKVEADTAALRKQLNKVEAQSKKSSEKMGKSFSTAYKVGLVAAAAAVVGLGLAIKRMMSTAVKDAAAAVEINQKFAVTFKEVGEAAEKSAKNLAENYGLAKDEAKELLVNTGDLLMGLGSQADVALETSERIQQLAVDMASFSNVAGGAAQASRALTKMYLGENEMVKELGVSLNEEMIKEELLAQGKDKLTGLALKRAKGEAALTLAVRQSANAMGDYARSMDSPANIMRRLQARARDLSVEMGTKMLPALSSAGQALLVMTEEGSAFGEILESIGSAGAAAITFLAGKFLSLGIYVENMRKGFLILKLEMLDILGKGVQASQKYKDTIKALGDSTLRLLKLEIAAAKLKESQTEEGKKAIVAAAKTAKAREKAAAKSAVINKQMLDDRKAFNDKWVALAGKAGKSETQLLEAEKTQQLSQLDKYYNEAKRGEEQYQQHRKTIEDQYNQKIMQSRLQMINSSIQMTQGLVGQLGAIFAQYAANQSMEIENEAVGRRDAITEWYEEQKDIIDNSADDQETRDKKLKALDEERARREKKLEEDIDKRKRKLAYETAKRQKVIAVSQSIMNTAQGVTAALGAIPWGPWNLAFATLVGTLGAVQTGLIMQQPLPKMAEGGLVSATSGGVPVVTAERNYDELIAPLTPEVYERLAEGIENAREERTSQAIKGDVYLDSTLIGEFISQGTEDGTIKIYNRSIV